MTTTIHPTAAQQQALYDMMNGDAVSNATRIPATGGGGEDDPPPVYLTPQALMAYCQSQLQNIDGQVQTVMTQQQNADSEQSAIGNILADLSNDAAVAGTGLMTDNDECKSLESKLESVITTMQKNDPTNSQLGTLEQLHDAIMATGSGPYTDGNGVFHGFYCSATQPGTFSGSQAPPTVNNSQDGALSAAEITGFSQTLTNVNSSINQDAQLGMIKVQSLISQQTTAITLTTSIMQSINDATQKIADKIGT